LLIYDDDLTLGDLAVVDLEGGPAQSLEVVKSMLVQLRKVEELLREAVGFAGLGDTLVKELLQALILRGHCTELVAQVSYAVMIMTLVRVPHILTLIAAEDYRRAVALMFEDVCVGLDLFAATVSVAALEFYLG